MFRRGDLLRVRGELWLFSALAGATLVASAGCSEHRISLQEFIAMQQAEPLSPATTQPAPLQEQEVSLLDHELGPYTVGAGDVLTVVVSGLDQAASLPSLQVRVDRNGEIQLPQAGALKVAGLELEDVEDMIHDAYVPKYLRDAVVNVTVVSPETTNVLVTGAVTLPGLVKLRRTERNALYALIMAGGFTELASGEMTLRRIRRPGEEVTLNLTEPEQLRAALALAPLEHGDIIRVRAATPNTVFVGGLVMAPHPQSYPPGTQVNVLQAIAAAGGLRTDVTPREGTLIRRVSGRDVQVKLDLDRISSGRDPNLVLASGDVLWVPDTIETRIQDWMNRNLFIRAGASATYGLNYNMPGVDFLNTAARQSQIGGTGSGGNLQDSFDPFGFLLRNQALQNLQTAVP
jgi:protein involved in polysaccharide export with SLBB domain